jgi:micrococcal nuclease
MATKRRLVLAVLMLTGVCLLSALEPAIAGVRTRATVIHITDGDTIWVEIVEPGHGLAPREKVRLVGIDCPERDQAPWGARATARLSTLVLGEMVEMEVALQSRDRYGRLLAAIWREGQLVQEQLVREGLCVPYVVPPNVEHAERIRAAAARARDEALGIYRPCEPLPEIPSASRHRQRLRERPPPAMSLDAPGCPF